MPASFDSRARSPQGLTRLSDRCLLCLAVCVLCVQQTQSASRIKEGCDSTARVALALSDSFFLVSNDDVTVGIGAMMEWMSQEPMRPTPSSHCDDKSLLSRPNCSPVAPTSRSLDHRRHGIYRCSPWMENPKLQQVSVTGSSATLVGALWCWSRLPPFCLSRPPMTHLHEKLLHEKRRHLVRAARSDGHFNGLHRPRNKTSITGWASQPMGGPWWEKPIKKSFEFCRLQNLAQLHAVYFGRHHCQSFRQPRECPPIPYAGGLFLVSGAKKGKARPSLWRIDEQMNRHQTPDDDPGRLAARLESGATSQPRFFRRAYQFRSIG